MDKNAPFGVDLLLPQVGGGARKTNHDYTNGARRRRPPSTTPQRLLRGPPRTHGGCGRLGVLRPGTLPQLIDIIIEEGTKLFVCAVGVPPVWAVEKLHAAGILVMNMVGAPKHVKKCLAVGVDLICAQGGEGGGAPAPRPPAVCEGSAKPQNVCPTVPIAPRLQLGLNSV